MGVGRPEVERGCVAYCGRCCEMGPSVDGIRRYRRFGRGGERVEREGEGERDCGTLSQQAAGLV